MERSGKTKNLGVIIVVLVVMLVIVALPIAVMTIPALRFLNPHAH
jgi:hypothetical protein